MEANIAKIAAPKLEALTAHHVFFGLKEEWCNVNQQPLEQYFFAKIEIRPKTT